MKKFSFLLMALLATSLMFSSCSDTDDGGSCSLPEPTCKPTVVRDADGNVSQLYFYENDRLVERQVFDGSGSVSYVDLYTYTDAGKIESHARQSGSESANKVFEYEYNGSGQAIAKKQYYTNGAVSGKHEYEYDGGSDITLTKRYVSNYGSSELSLDMATKHYYQNGKRVIDSLYWQGDLTQPSYNYKKYHYNGDNLIRTESFLLLSDGTFELRDVTKIEYDAQGRYVAGEEWRRGRDDDTLIFEGSHTVSYTEGQQLQTSYIDNALPSSYSLNWGKPGLESEMISKDEDGQINSQYTKTYEFNEDGYPTMVKTVDPENSYNNSEIYFTYCCSCN